jgi:hypothetical protein
VRQEREEGRSGREMIGRLTRRITIHKSVGYNRKGGGRDVLVQRRRAHRASRLRQMVEMAVEEMEEDAQGLGGRQRSVSGAIPRGCRSRSTIS